MNSPDESLHATPPAGTRGRIKAPIPPAPIPERLAHTEEPSQEGQPAAVEDQAPDRDSDTAVVRAGSTMAIATLLSRITGFLRNLLIGSTMGAGVASAFTTANTLPNLITEIVLGAILTSLVIPVLVRAEKEDPDRGAAFIRRLLTVASTLLVGVTVLAVAAAPLLVHLSLDSDGKVNIPMATVFAYLLLPQILFYGLFALLMAVLNTKGIFGPGAWAPVVNNVIVLVVLATYWFIPGALEPHSSVSLTDPHILWLGLGTTAGVVVQALILVPYLRKAGIDLRPLWGIDDRIKQFAGMGAAIVLYVAISQLGFFYTNRIASMADPGALFIYQQHWLLLQVPYGVIGVTLLTAIMPRLSRNAADGDNKAVVRDLTMATKVTLMALIPIIVYFTVFGTTISSALFQWGRFDAAEADILGQTLSFGAFTLIPYSIVLLHLRVFYAREQAWTPTFIIIGITATKVILSTLAPVIATDPHFVVVLLAAANGFGFVTGALVGAILLRRSLGSLDSGSVLRSVAWVLAASLAGAAFAWLADLALSGLGSLLGPKLGTLLRMMITGIILVVIAAVVLAKSGLDEVALFGRALGRIPGLRRLAPAPSTASTTGTSGTAADAADTYFVTAVTTATPNLPPMSGGFVRGPRLVPGAAVAGGRFRLLADHGGTPAMRLWQAREQSSGDTVALTIIDASRLPEAHDVRATQAITDGIIRDTTALRDTHIAAGCAGLAPIRGIIRDSAGCIVVADWVPGSSLSAVARQSPQPTAAARAVADIADAVAAAGAGGAVLGIDHRDRLRVSADGHAVVAFPGVLPHNSHLQDVHGIGVALGLLLEFVPDIPADIAKIRTDALNAKTADAAQLATRLRAGEAPAASALHPEAESSPDPQPTPGFGEAPTRPSAQAGLYVAATVVVLVAALIAAFLMGKLGNSRGSNAPLNSDSLGRISAPTTTAPAPQPIQVAQATYWQPPGGRGTPDNPELVGTIVDGSPATAWYSDIYRTQLGPSRSAVKAGIGLMVSAQQPGQLGAVRIDGGLVGTHVQLRAASSADPSSLEDTQVIGEADLADGTTLIPVNSDQPVQFVLLWITQLPLPEAARISEVTLQATP